MIPFLVVMGALYWLAAPDPVTAGARTAAGTAARAAGTGVRSHWAAGRPGRELHRTDRRDRWNRRDPKTWQRRALKAEHGAVIAAKAAKGTVGLTAAAVRPVPAAVKAGWNRGRERHRVKAGNRPVPVALDPPWWRREQQQVQPGEQAGDSPAEQVQASGGQAEGTDGLDTEEQIRNRRTPTWSRLHPKPLTESDRRFWTARDAGYTGPPLDQDGWPGDPDQRPGIWQDPPIAGAVCDAVNSYDPDGAMTVGEAAGRDRRKLRTVAVNPCGALVTRKIPKRVPTLYDSSPDAMSEPIGTETRTVRCRNEAGPGGYCDEHWRGDGNRQPLKADPDPTDTTTDPTATPTPTEGDPVFTSLDTDLDDLTTTEDFAVKVADMAEESDFAQLMEFCKNASDEVRDFGADMAGDVAEFEEVAAKIGDLLSELVDAATKVKDRAKELVGG